MTIPTRSSRLKPWRWKGGLLLVLPTQEIREAFELWFWCGWVLLSKLLATNWLHYEILMPPCDVVRVRFAATTLITRCLVYNTSFLNFSIPLFAKEERICCMFMTLGSKSHAALAIITRVIIKTFNPNLIFNVHCLSYAVWVVEHTASLIHSTERSTL